VKISVATRMILVTVNIKISLINLVPV